MCRENRNYPAAINNDTVFYYTVEPLRSVVSSIGDKDRLDRLNVVTIEYSPFLFGSLYSKTTAEEAGLIINSMALNIKNFNSDVADMIRKWDLCLYADMDFHSLSGGFKKFVFLAMQVEPRKSAENIIAINIQHQLDKERFSLIETGLSNNKVHSVLWVEDNPKLLLRKCSIEPRLITFVDWVSLLEADHD